MNRFKKFKFLNINFKMYSDTKIKESNNSLMPFINAEQSRLIDEELMSNEIGYSIDQLMEVAGLSVALAVNDAIHKNEGWKNVKKILNISGPGSKFR